MDKIKFPLFIQDVCGCVRVCVIRRTLVTDVLTGAFVHFQVSASI